MSASVAANFAKRDPPNKGQRVPEPTVGENGRALKGTCRDLLLDEKRSATAMIVGAKIWTHDAKKQERVAEILRIPW